ncbi:hypothetical protein BDQ12DRAFT_661710 [Crucibulum laeve]|uniref:Uncharacterized protein n=1 Tax=Crucibulum laeve TaxID=68775 RepID=A0A5C3MMB6_9AGAR|nr:hypothetical protein BDQ12DRAFT_661710 [Crucibulum laeve]
MEDLITSDAADCRSHGHTSSFLPLALQKGYLPHRFDQSFFADHSPPHHEPSTPLQYLSPEAFKPFLNLKPASYQTVGRWHARIHEMQAGPASRGEARGRLVGYGSTNQRSLQQALREIVAQDEVPNVEDRRMFEKARTKLEGAEVKLLADPLEKMLKYYPRIGSL